MAKPQQVVRVYEVDPDTGAERETALGGPAAAIQTFIQEQIGFVGRVMSGYESMARLTADANAELREEIRSVRESRRKDTETHIQLVRTLESLLSEQHERELASERAKARMAIESKMADEALALGPVVIKRLAGIKLTEGMPDTMKSFLRTVTPEQLDIESGTIKLEPGQLAALGEIVQELADAEEKGAKP